MKEQNEAERVTLRMADDACLFCGVHGEHSGGHLFIGKRQEDGSLLSDTGWVCIEHQSCCAVQICPKCAKRAFIDSSKLTVSDDNRIVQIKNILLDMSKDSDELINEVLDIQLAHTLLELQGE